MIASKIMENVRRSIKDIGKANVSDYEIYEAINESLRIIAEITRGADWPLFKKEATITFTSGVGSLPVDYIAIDRGISDAGDEMLLVSHDSSPGELEFNIKGSSVLSGEDTMKMWYHGYAAEIVSGAATAGATVIDLPLSWLMPLSQMTAASLSGNPQSMVQIAAIFSGVRVQGNEQQEPDATADKK